MGTRIIYDRDQVFEFIVDYKRTSDGNSPTIREIMRHFGINSTSNILYILEELKRVGKIELAGGARKIRVVGWRWEYKNDL